MPVNFRFIAAQTKRFWIELLKSNNITARHNAYAPLVIAIAVLTIVSGCNAKKAPETGSSTATTWDLISIHDQPVGYQQTTLTRSSPAGTEAYDGVVRTQLRVQRFGEEIVETMELASREDHNGEVVRIELRSAPKSFIRGLRKGAVLEMEASQAGQPIRRWQLPLPEGCGGFFAMEWSLRRSPIKPGEHRELKAVMPILNQVANIVLDADSTRNDDGLLRVENRAVLPDGTEILGVIWVDDGGDVLRSELPSLGQVSIRTTEALATAAPSASNYDVAANSTIPVRQPFPSPHQSREATYRVTVNETPVTELFPGTLGQIVESTSPQTATIKVKAITPRPGGIADGASASAEALRLASESSLLIQSDAPEITRLAEKLPGTDAAEIALAAENFVFRLVSKKNFSTTFASATEVAQSREGDCTEHAVLTAALCRARGVPCRVLLGLVYVPSLKSFGFHMWNEFYNGEHWVPIDATLGLGGTGAAHLILARTNLATESGLGACLPVLRAIGQLQIELLDVKHP